MADTPPSVGAEAPDFTGTTAVGQSFKLSDLRGKTAVVLFFYPKANTPG